MIILLLVPENALRADVETLFLDDTDIADVEKALGVELVVSSDNGAEFLRRIIDLED